MSSAPALVQRTATRGSLDVVVDVVGLSPDPVPYARGLELQRAAAARVVAGEDRGTVLLLEHESVYTAGLALQALGVPDRRHTGGPG
ncbi:hypothetical protein [Salana multivorans]